MAKVHTGSSWGEVVGSGEQALADGLADRQRRRGRGRWGVQGVDDPRRIAEGEVLHELTVAVDGLGSYARWRGHEIVLGDLGHEALQRAGEGADAQRSTDLGGSGPPEPASKAAGMGRADQLPELGWLDGAPSVSLTSEGGYGRSGRSGSHRRPSG